jgi:predicted permease
MFSSYIFIAAIIGIFVNITGLTLPLELLKSLDYFIRVFPFLAILYLSLQVDITLIIKRRIFGLMYLFRTAILLIAILLLGVILNLDKITIITLSLIFVAPFAPFMFGLSRDEGYDTSESGAMTSASMMWAIVVATLVTLVISIYA